MLFTRRELLGSSLFIPVGMQRRRILARAPSVVTYPPYSTSFPLTENPINESGKWKNGLADGLDWCNVRTNGSIAYGIGTHGAHYDDATAILTGTWAANQRAKATVYINSPTGTPELELRLRSTLGAHVNTGYEIYFSAINAYNPAIVRWDGLDSYSILKNDVAKSISNGDVIEAQISGSTITVYVNGSPLMSATDGTYSSGNPGIGFYTTEDYTNKWGHSHFQAWEL